MTSDLVERAQRGDHEAFEALAVDAYHRLYAIATRMLRDGYAADDAVQETLVRAWRDLRSLRDRDRFGGWLHRLLVRACADQASRSRGRRFELAIDHNEPVDPTDDMARIGDRDEIERAFLTLPLEQRAVLVLAHYVGLPAPEIADSLGIPIGTVYSRIHRAKRTLRSRLADPAPIAAARNGR